jgi:DNA topoisomerase-1
VSKLKQLTGLLDICTNLLEVWMSSKHGSHNQQSHGRGSSGMSATKKDSTGKHVMADGSPLPSHIPRIPPAWTGVTVSTDPKSPLVVKGKDDKGRTQSVYSADHTMQKAQQKFLRVSKLRKELSSVDGKLDSDMESDIPAISSAASVLALVHHTGLRPGSDKDTGADKKAYGATTLEGRHVTKTADGVRLKFIGKKGVSLDIPVHDSQVAESLIKRSALSGANGRLFSTNGRQLRNYTDKVSGGFKPKDFRTAKGTNTAVKAMAGMKPPTTLKEYKKSVKAVAAVVADQLGNTPTIALQSYIDPVVFSSWRIE